MIKIMARVSLSSGQSLIELLVALTLMMLLVVAVVGLATVSVKTSYFAKKETAAKRYAEELVEWLREQKKSDWTSFLFDKSTTEGQVYCFNTSPIASWPSVGVCSNATLDGMYKREVTLSRSLDNSSVVVTVVVSWEDSSGLHETKLVSNFANPN